MPRRSKRTFTKRTIDHLPPGTEKGTWYGDASLPGFAMRSYADGKKTFCVRYRVKGRGIRRIVSLGRYGLVTLDQAKGRAKEVLAAAALGSDLYAAHKAPAWNEWTKTFIKRLDVKRPGEHQRYLGFTEEKNATTGAPTDDTFREIRRRWAPRPLDTITPNDIEEARALVRRGGKIRANRFLACVAAVFAAAVRTELISRNPAAAVRPDRENPSRSRVLSRDELKALFTALEAESDPYNRAAVLLLTLTGARTGELLSMEWKHVDLDARRVRLDDSKSGKPRLLALPPRAVELLRNLPHLGRFVIPGRDADKPRETIRHLWLRLCERAGLEDVTPHDLRRTHGLELSRVAGIRIASLALGHETIRTTEATYSPEAFGAIQAATDAREKLLPFPEEKKPNEGEGGTA